MLLTKLKYKEAIALDGGIREATAVPLTRLRRLPVCVEGSLGQNGLFGGPSWENDVAKKRYKNQLFFDG